MKQRHPHRLYPHPQRRAMLAKGFGCDRLVWNDALAKGRELDAAGEKSSHGVLAKWRIAQAKKTGEPGWLSDPGNVALQGSIRFMSHVFCRGKRTPSLGVGSVPIAWSRDPPSAPRSGALIPDAATLCLTSVVVDVAPTPRPANGKATGLDPGFAPLAVIPDGAKAAPPEFLPSALKRPGRLQDDPRHKQQGPNRIPSVR